MSSEVFAALKPVFAKAARRLTITVDAAAEYTLVAKSPSPFPQHKGQPLFFGSVRIGKSYVSVHLLPLYMSPALNEGISPALKKRMQGKACFNFKTNPDPELVAELKRLVEAGLKQWVDQGWV